MTDVKYSFITIKPSDLKEPEWSRDWDKTIHLNLVLNENGVLTDPSPFIWTSPGLKESEDIDDPV